MCRVCSGAEGLYIEVGFSKEIISLTSITLFSAVILPLTVLICFFYKIPYNISIPAEFGNTISNDEWGYLEGVLDQGLTFGIWPSRTQNGVFTHRIDLYNTSKGLSYSFTGTVWRQNTGSVSPES